MTKRNETRIVKVGNRYLGGDNPILIQSMTNTKTKDVEATIKQINELEKLGCEIIRVAVLDKEDAYSISKIKKYKEKNEKRLEHLIHYEERMNQLKLELKKTKKELSEEGRRHA